MGFVSGSLIISSVINPFGVARILLFVIGLYILTDSFFPFGERHYPVSVIVSFAFGGVVMAVFSFAGLSHAYTAFVSVFAVYIYISKIRRRLGLER